VRRTEARLRARWDDPAALVEAEDTKLARLGFDPASAAARLDDALAALGRPPFDPERDSIHWLIFAGLAGSTERPDILEIGTFDGRFTALLSVLFPNGRIVTVDLPESDPILAATYGRGDPAARQEAADEQRRNTSAETVTQLHCNSLFLLDALDDRPDAPGAFDLIWVDGGHLYPEIAWDLAFAFRLVRPGGWVAVDDIVFSPAAAARGYTGTATLEALEYVTARTGTDVSYLLKRRGANASVPRRRKFVAVAPIGPHRSTGARSGAGSAG
jgi:predicted O-methyltransferase YrrM